VFDEEDRLLGILGEMFSTPAHDIWVARSGEKEYLIPAVDEVVLAVDLEKKTVRVKNWKELWEVDGC
jgi:16S rRNA processing protein RimM